MWPVIPVWMPPVASLLFGLVFGSFANVVIYRFPRGESLSYPASHCPGCGSTIRWYDNVPVMSWVLLRGRCRDCGEGISPRYPLVETTSGLLWVLAWVLFGVTWQTLFAIAFFYLLLILAAIDLDTYRLPNVLVGVLAGVGVVGVIVGVAADAPAVPLLGSGEPVATALAGVASSAGIALAIALLYEVVRKRQGFGMGDVKLLAAIGVFLGPYGVMVLFVGSVLGAVVGVWQTARGSGGLAAKIPFGPFLAAGAVMVTAFGPAAWSWYWGLLR